MGFTDNVVDKIGTRLFEVSKRFKDYAPKEKKKYKGFNEDEVKMLIAQHGIEAVQNMFRGQ